jgi:hypothetical protein
MSILFFFSGYIVTFTKVLTIYLRVASSIILLYLPTPLGIVSTGPIVPFSYISTYYFHYIRFLLPFGDGVL